ncbi:MAG: response regulator transcription factor [Chitinophagia bacterium]|jgi:DNA-binding NarL/FixJ family response regulator
MKIFKIGIVDDHLLFAEGISRLITPEKGFCLSFISSKANELSELIREHSVDILILDVNIPPYNGLEQIKPLKTAFPELQIMILTMYQPSDLGLQINKFEGDAYVLKISGKHIFEDALTHMKKYQPYFDPNIIENSNEPKNHISADRLTRREKEIISLIIAGKTTKEIAAELFLSELTIKTHRRNISEKLGSKGIADLITKTSHFRKF